jgi:hypothetical protein
MTSGAQEGRRGERRGTAREAGLQPGPGCQQGGGTRGIERRFNHGLHGWARILNGLGESVLSAIRGQEGVVKRDKRDGSDRRDGGRASRTWEMPELKLVAVSCGQLRQKIKKSCLQPGKNCRVDTRDGRYESDRRDGEGA